MIYSKGYPFAKALKELQKYTEFLNNITITQCVNVLITCIRGLSHPSPKERVRLSEGCFQLMPSSLYESHVGNIKYLAFLKIFNFT